MTLLLQLEQEHQCKAPLGGLAPPPPRVPYVVRRTPICLPTRFSIKFHVMKSMPTLDLYTIELH